MQDEPDWAKAEKRRQEMAHQGGPGSGPPPLRGHAVPTPAERIREMADPENGVERRVLSLARRVRALERRSSNIEFIAWLALAAAIGQILGSVSWVSLFR